MQIYNTMMYFSRKVEKNSQIYNTMMYFSRKYEKKMKIYNTMMYFSRKVQKKCKFTIQWCLLVVKSKNYTNLQYNDVF